MPERERETKREKLSEDHSGCPPVGGNKNHASLSQWLIVLLAIAYALRLSLRLRSGIVQFPIFYWRLGLSGGRSEVIVRLSPRPTGTARRRVDESLGFGVMRRRSRRSRDDRFED